MGDKLQSTEHSTVHVTAPAATDVAAVAVVVVVVVIGEGSLLFL